MLDPGLCDELSCGYAAWNETAPAVSQAGDNAAYDIIRAMVSRRRWLHVGLWFATFLLSNLLILFGDNLPFKAASILLLAGFLPGMAAVHALFPAEGELDPWERIGIGFSLGLFGSLQVVWCYMLVPGRSFMPVLLSLLDTFAAALGLIALWRLRHIPASANTEWRPSRETVMGFALLVAAAMLLFLNLGRTEYDHDETPVLSDAVATILGNDSAVFSLRKGPAQIVIATTFTLLGDSVAEGFVRIPFAMAGLATTIVFWRLARRLLGGGAALAALALWLAEGMHLGESRWVQYQNIVLLTALCAVLCFVLAARSNGSLRLRFQLLGAFFFASGLFAHYDGAFVAPVLGMLWLWMERGSLRKWHTWLPAGLLAALIALVAAPFYAALTQQGGAGAYFASYIFGLRVGRGPYNMMPSFYQRMAVLEAPGWIIAVASGLLLAALIVGKRIWVRHRWMGMLWFAMLACAVIAAIFPDMLEIAGVNLSFVPYAALLAVLILAPAAGLTARVLGVWALSAWLFPAFWMQVPGDHYFASMPALTLLAVWSWALTAGTLARRLHTPAVRVVFGAATALASVSGIAYVYAMLVSSQPEYAMLYPDALPRPLALFSGERPPLLYGAYPHQSGWRAVAVLYELGLLHGEYESNEMHAIADWYLSINWWPAKSRPRYYLHVLRPFAPILASEVPSDLEQKHWLIGQITVAGEPRMLVYQVHGDGVPPPMRTWPVEAFESGWQRLTTLARFTAYHDGGRDDSAFYAVARQLETEGRPGDAVLLDGAHGRSLLARFYGGNLPLVTSMEDPGAKNARHIWGVYWASPDREGERYLAERSCPATSRWFQNVRLTLNGAAVYGTAVPVDAAFGAMARVRSIAFSPEAPRGGILCVRIDWETLGSTDAPYKLFLHMIGADGKVAAQSDTEPLAGFKPTTEWRSGERFSDNVGVALPPELLPGTVRVLIGLYNGADGIRLPASTSAGKAYENNVVEIGTITIR